MEDGGDSSIPRSDFNSKLVGEQRSSDEFQQKDGLSRKRVKMRHLDSVFRSDEMNGFDSKSLKTNEDDMSPLTDVKVASDFESETTLPLDLNAEFCFPTNSDTNSANSRGIALDLNVEDVSSSVNQDHFHPCKNTSVLKPRDVSHCETETSTALEKDPLRVWKEMKQNGFLSSSHGGICVQNSVVSSSHGGIPVPKKRGRKSKNDHVLNKRMELAKREQVDRFTKIAAPTGLLNGLNPGIINHVRNRKQVHSIIQALVKSEKPEPLHSQPKHANHLNTNDSTPHQLGYSDQCWHTNTFSSTSTKQTTGCTIPTLKPCSSNSEECGDGDSSMINQVREGGTLVFKLSSSAKTSDNTNSSSLSNEESATLITASSLSVKAASVASQWLELLQQDIKGRLSALRRSKKRVRDVIATDLPFLISKEFSSDQENDPYIMQNISATADQHRARWSALFDQMDKALSEEEKQLESWSYQVKEMQLHCDQGLNHIHGNMIYGLQQLGASIVESKLGKGDGSESEKELAVRAAAASIYSTCNFLLTKENVSCF
ncbi:hypothetical protein SLE2022_065460 [Rubroshorea leprosula]